MMAAHEIGWREGFRILAAHRAEAGKLLACEHVPFRIEELKDLDQNRKQPPRAMCKAIRAVFEVSRVRYTTFDIGAIADEVGHRLQ